MAQHKWKKEEEETIRSMTWDDGFSASVVADKVATMWGFHVTRNMVLGVLHRRGWAGAHKEVPKLTKAAKMRASAAGRRAQSPSPQFGFPSPKSSVVVREPVELPVEDQKPHNCYALTHIDPEKERPNHTCQWFYGDPLVDPFGFCPVKKVPGLPYCNKHAAKAFQPPQPKSRSVQSVPASAPVEPETEKV